jgi:hypothetical protein
LTQERQNLSIVAWPDVGKKTKVQAGCQTRIREHVIIIIRLAPGETMKDWTWEDLPRLESSVLWKLHLPRVLDDTARTRQLSECLQFICL